MVRKKLRKSVLAVSMSAVLAAGTAGAVYAEETERQSALEGSEIQADEQRSEAQDASGEESETQSAAGETVIILSDEGVLVDGAEISQDEASAVYAGAEMVYYHAGQDTAYGAGDETDGHTEEEAAEHTVITITQPGTYRVTGSISRGQIAVDLGEDSREDENAVVTLILDQADITCTVASAIVVYNAYECGNDDPTTAVKDVDTSKAGFRLVLADDSENTVNGSHVAKIYKEGTTQEEVDAGEAKKAWKFDAAIDSLVSLNIDGEEKGNGRLEVTSDNEGIETSLHMTINGGEITVNSADDAINTNEDNVSVMTINDGVVLCNSGLGEEGDGIDSNGWIVINGGFVIASANADSQDSGVDSDLGIYINGGTVLATGNMYDEVSGDSAQPFTVLSFTDKVEAGQLLMLKNSGEEAVTAFSAANDFQTLVYSSSLLTEGDYTLYEVSSVTGDLDGSIYTNITEYQDEEQLQYSSTAIMGPGGGMGFGGPEGGGAGGQPGDFGGGERPEPPEGTEGGDQPGDFGGGERPERPEGEEGENPPEDFEGGERPEGTEGENPPEGLRDGERLERPEGAEGRGQMEDFEAGAGGAAQESSTAFSISGISNIFAQISPIA
ncbi:MAG: carbohydrate-binding domain-containing protein [Lachnospiraceae bacterium]|nr:carbohydrate-binding domain-containing protein [Lachnospiraceae bacterium]